VEDAMHATRAGVEEECPSGGTGFFAQRCVGDLEGRRCDEQTGISIVRKALEQPIRQIAENAGVRVRLSWTKSARKKTPTSA